MPQITIEKLGGFAPKWFLNSYPSYGNRNHAGDMNDIDPIDPSCVTQGKGVVALTNGTQAGAVTTLIKGITRNAVTSGVGYAVGGAKLYKFSSSAVTSEAGPPAWPHTIDKATVTGEDGEDVCHYKSNLYYSYNHSSSAGDIGKYDLSSTLDDDWGSTVPTGAAALQSAPHQMILGGDDAMYIANGVYVARYDGTTFTADALDFYDDSQVSSITWNDNRVIIASNRPNITGSNSNQSAIYRWTGYSDSWEGDPIEINGRIGALYTKNGTTFVWYENFINGTARPIFGYIAEGIIKPLMMFSGSLPLYYQVGELGDYIVWLSDNKVYLYGDLTSEAVGLWKYMTTTRATGGGIASPFGVLMLASNASTNYQFEKESGYSILSTYNTLMFPLSSATQVAQINSITVWTEQMSTGAKLDTTLRYDGGKSSKALTQIAYSTANKTRHVIGARNLPRVEDCRLEFSWANGSATNPVKIKRVEIDLDFVDRK